MQEKAAEQAKAREEAAIAETEREKRISQENSDDKRDSASVAEPVAET